MSLAKKLPAQDCAALIAKLQGQALGPEDTSQAIQWLELALELFLTFRRKMEP